MALATLLAHLAAGRFARVLALTSGGAPTASADALRGTCGESE